MALYPAQLKPNPAKYPLAVTAPSYRYPKASPAWAAVALWTKVAVVVSLLEA